MSFERLSSRVELRGTLECVTALHVGMGSEGGGRFLPAGALLRDVLDRPYIPGSSLRGCLRSGLEAILRGVDPALACDPSGPESGCRVPAAGPPCAVCGLFGCRGLASRLAVLDAPVAEPWEAWMAGARGTVPIDRETETASPHGRRSFETVPAGARFVMELSVENSEEQPLDHLGLLFTVVDLLDRGLLTLGGHKAAGLGRVRVLWEVAMFNTARSYLGLEPAKRLSGAEVVSLAASCRERLQGQLGALASAGRES
jgi:CRISPR/Cas system CSM-associated protein Csm3 (group 7 of RAMP superfamily)